MPRRKQTQNGDQSNTNASADQPATAENSPAASKITMDEFMGRADRGDWLTIKQAADHLGVAPAKTQSVRNAIKNRAEFKAEGATLLVTIEGYDIPPLTYVSRAAVNLYRDNNAAGKNNVRQPRGGKTRFILRLSPDQKATLETVFTQYDNLHGLVFEPASTPKKKATDAASASPSGTTAANDANATDNTLEGRNNADQQPADVFETADQPN